MALLRPASSGTAADGSAAPSPSASGQAFVQRSLIAELPALVGSEPPATAASTADLTPAVQRIRYEDVAPVESGPHTGRPAEAIEPIESAFSSASGAASFTDPSEAIRPAVAPSAVRGPDASGGGAGPAMVQRSTSAPRASATPPGSLGLQGFSAAAPIGAAQPISDPVATPPAMVQRHVENSSSSSGGGSLGGSTTFSTPAPADDSASAISARTVGLAEMFALAAGQESDGPSVQRSTDTEVQLAPADSPTPAPSASPAPAAGAAAGPAAPPSGAELEEMARRLYDPLTARLRAELWQDRERAGLLTDLRP